MKERPILYSAPLVRAKLAGLKTMTRRLVKPRPDGLPICDPSDGAWYVDGGTWCKRCPYGVAGDRLWTRETWADADIMYQEHTNDVPSVIAYRADKSAILFEAKKPSPVPAWDLESWNFDALKWRPSIHMPRWASRIDDEITAVRVERLQDITEEDAKAEGVAPFFERFPSIGRDQRITTGELAADAEHRAAFAVLWDEISGARSTWASNPWVWVVSTKQVRP